MIRSAQGDTLDPVGHAGFGDSARLVRRLRQRDEPTGWLTELWGPLARHPFWASRKRCGMSRPTAMWCCTWSTPPSRQAAAGYVASEMELLGWLGKPVLVLLNQLGAPRAPRDEAAEQQAWTAHVTPFAHVRGVLAMDAFARCWVHEMTLLDAVQRLLDGEQAAAMARLASAWTARRQGSFAASTQVLGESVARIAASREVVPGGIGIGDVFKRVGATLAKRDVAATRPRGAAATGAGDADRSAHQHRAAAGAARPAGPVRRRDPGTRGDAVRGSRKGLRGPCGGLRRGAQRALVGLKADVLSGGLTLAAASSRWAARRAGGAGVARGVNLVRGTDQSWVAWSDEALDGAVQSALLRYLAVAHFGRGRGDWAEGEAPAHWRDTVQAALMPHRATLTALWHGRSKKRDTRDSVTALGATLTPIVDAAARAALARLYPAATALAFGTRVGLGIGYRGRGSRHRCPGCRARRGGGKRYAI